jgi:hypothetical protein
MRGGARGDFRLDQRHHGFRRPQGDERQRSLQCCFYGDEHLWSNPRRGPSPPAFSCHETEDIPAADACALGSALIEGANELERLTGTVSACVREPAGIFSRARVGGLDHPRVEHALLRVDHAKRLALHLEQRRLQTSMPIGASATPGLSEDSLDPGDRITHQAGIRGDRAAEPEEARPPVLLSHGEYSL